LAQARVTRLRSGSPMVASSPAEITSDFPHLRAPNVQLTWPGKDARTVPLPTRIVPVRAGSDPVTLIQGDNAAAMRALRAELTGKVTLAYLDPPFFTSSRDAPTFE
jgi:hypothetical protein